MIKLDLYDKKILAKLDINARASGSEIARDLQISKETVNYKINRLKREGIIRRFYTIMNSSRLGYTYYKFLLKLQGTDPELERELMAFLASERKNSNLRKLEGYFDISFLSMHKDILSLKRFTYGLIDKYGKFVQERSVHLITKSHKFNQRMLYTVGMEHKSFEHEAYEELNLDRTDLLILRTISSNARIRITDLAREVSQDARVVSYRLKKLCKHGVIVGYSTALNTPLLEKNMSELSIQVNNPCKIPAILELVNQSNACISAMEMIGDYDLSVELYTNNDKHLMIIVDGLKESFSEHISDYDISSVTDERVSNWAPFTAFPMAEKKEIRDETQ